MTLGLLMETFLVAGDLERLLLLLPPPRPVVQKQLDGPVKVSVEIYSVQKPEAFIYFAH